MKKIGGGKRTNVSCLFPLFTGRTCKRVDVNRKHLVSSSLEFGSLVENSSHWKTLTDKIDSDSFLTSVKQN